MSSPSVVILPLFSFSKCEIDIFVFEMAYCAQEDNCVPVEIG